MKKIRIKLPLAAITRIVNQSPRVSPLQSCHEELWFACSSFSDLSTYLATPGNECYLYITDIAQIWPYSLTEFNILDTPTDPGIWVPYRADFYITAAQTTPALAATFLAAQFNAFFAKFRGGYPAFRSAYAAANGDNLVLFLSWGFVGTGAGEADGPLGEETLTERCPGVDNPLWIGRIGPRRHIFWVEPTYPGPYYGQPIG